MIDIVPYDSRWPEEFEALAKPLRDALGKHAVRVDHIGSTAVPGLVAKDKIDIQVTVYKLSSEVKVAITSLGYVHHAELTADHRPPQTTGPDEGWKKWTFSAPAGQRPANVHVRVEGRANQRYALLFRDYLQTHPATRDAYGIIKQQLARLHPGDPDAYYAIKDPVCDLIWQAAEEWEQREDIHMEKKRVESWVEGYLKAWNSNDPGDIGRLFAEKASYYTGPFDEPWQGREAIVHGWLDRKDEPGTFNFRYEVLATAEDLGIVRGWTKYFEPEREYGNLWLIRINDQGRCMEFTEWWVQRT